MSLAECLSNRSDLSADGSPGSGTPGEMGLRRALESALGSLGALSTIYDQREARWRDEMCRLNDDREGVELLLPSAYAERVAHAQSGNYLDHGVRVNSVFSNYLISGPSNSQRIGDLAGSAFPDKDTLMILDGARSDCSQYRMFR